MILFSPPYSSALTNIGFAAPSVEYPEGTVSTLDQDPSVKAVEKDSEMRTQ